MHRRNRNEATRKKKEKKKTLKAKEDSVFLTLSLMYKLTLDKTHTYVHACAFNYLILFDIKPITFSQIRFTNFKDMNRNFKQNTNDFHLQICFLLIAYKVHFKHPLHFECTRFKLLMTIIMFLVS